MVRFVDHKSNIREEFLGFLHCKDGTSGEALANLIMGQLKELGIYINDCCGQGYDGAGNMSGKYKGVAARIMNINELAIYCHCQAYSLSLDVCFACEMPVVITMMNKLRCVYEFFDYPKRAELLERKICETYDADYVKRKKLKDCKTRWVEKVDSFQIFFFV